MNRAQIGTLIAVLMAILAVGAAWVDLNSRVSQDHVMIQDLQMEMSRARDRLDRFIDGSPK